MGLNLKIARIRKGLSQNQLAEIVKVSPATISKLECGKLNPRIDVVKRLAKALDVSVSELINDEQ